ncbi:hypothetical protein [Streptomyces sp. NPDC088915]|uniref:hypothetical protein n=1 Tax=Streptomyces sp. NPDC088915 TaxID=3365912 RepID=UPI0038141DDC
MYETASLNRPGGITRLGPGSADTKEQVLRHPASARSEEYLMAAGRPAYAKGRIVITPSGVDGDDAQHGPRMLSFAPGRP